MCDMGWPYDPVAVGELCADIAAKSFLFDELASVRSLFAVCPLCDCPAVCDAADRMAPTHTEH